MAESAVFRKGRANVPAYVLLEIQTGQEVQVYDVRIQFKARFSGLRWLMYNHRVMSFFAFTSAFWFAEILFTGLGWITLRYIFISPKTKMEGSIKGDDTDGTVKGEIKEEPETDEPDLSDTPRTFPTYGKQQPLRYVPKVKDEDSEDFVLDETAIQPLAAMEADDEEDEEDSFRARDSGIGTSFSEGGERRSGVARRRSGRGRGGGS